ncbi:hypothetical protein ACFX15_039476 [Malus domestica]
MEGLGSNPSSQTLELDSSSSSIFDPLTHWLLAEFTQGPPLVDPSNKTRGIRWETLSFQKLTNFVSHLCTINFRTRQYQSSANAHVCTSQVSGNELNRPVLIKLPLTIFQASSTILSLVTAVAASGTKNSAVSPPFSSRQYSVDDGEEEGEGSISMEGEGEETRRQSDRAPPRAPTRALGF